MPEHPISLPSGEQRSSRPVASRAGSPAGRAMVPVPPPIFVLEPRRRLGASVEPRGKRNRDGGSPENTRSVVERALGTFGRDSRRPSGMGTSPARPPRRTPGFDGGGPLGGQWRSRSGSRGRSPARRPRAGGERCHDPRATRGTKTYPVASAPQPVEATGEPSGQGFYVLRHLGRSAGRMAPVTRRHSLAAKARWLTRSRVR